MSRRSEHRRDRDLVPGALPGRDEDRGLPANLTLQLMSGPGAVPAARRAIAGLAGHVGIGTLGDLRLLVSELVTNSVRHAGLGDGDAIGLQISVSPRRVRVEVTDVGPGFERRAPEPREDRAGGYGLFLVDRLADRWGVLSDEVTRVWFEIDQDAASGGA
jgi:anti-sigma regulatory factor (Ser/Thr protein kinase)